MNIFVTSLDPIESARVLDDKRLIKMILETAQLLSTAIHMQNGVGPYRITHKNHPCSVWVRSTRANYQWTLEHFIALFTEYTRRFNKVHKCSEHLNFFESQINLMPEESLTPFQNCTPFKHMETIKAYQACLFWKWILDKNPRWTNANPPNWYCRNW